MLFRICFKVRQGLTPLTHFLTNEEIDFLLDAYYQARGWNKNGMPTKKTLKRLGLEDVALTFPFPVFE